MLHIKLSKKRVAHTLMTLAAVHTDLAKKNEGNIGVERTMNAQAEQLQRWARAAQQSTGDVYVSMELWNQIEGYYDV